jgi:hypothetical protein
VTSVAGRSELLSQRGTAGEGRDVEWVDRLVSYALVGGVD